MAAWLDRVRERALRVSDIREQSQHQQQSALPNLAKVLGVWQLTFLGLGSIIGAGIYVLVGFTAHDVAGPGVILSYVIAGIAAMISALCYAEYSVGFPVAGGAFAYTSSTFGELIAWTCGWSMSLQTTLSSSAVSRGFSSYLSILWIGGVARSGPAQETLTIPLGPVTLDPIAFVLIIILTIILSIGIRESARFNMVVCLVNISCIIFVICSGLPVIDFRNLDPFLPFGVKGVFSASSIVFFSFIGFDYIANAAEEAKNPSRDLPLSIIGSLSVASLLYVLMSVTMVTLQKYTDIDIRSPFSSAFVSHGNTVTAYIVSCGALCGIVTSTMTGLLSQTRLLTVLGRQRFLPPILSHVYHKTSTPLVATWVTGIISGFLALSIDIAVLAEAVSAGCLYVFFLVNLGVLVRNTCIHPHKRTKEVEGSLSKQIQLITYACVSWICISSALLSISFTLDMNALLLIGIALSWMASVTMLHLHCSKKHAHDPAESPSSTSGSARKGDFKVPLFPWTPAFGVLSTTHLLCSLSWVTLVQFLIYMLLGVILYIVFGSHRIEQFEKHSQTSSVSGVELHSLLPHRAHPESSHS
mmetsp:Transcript_12496/g.25096  ORF Transcript_12496/g.25096 Transcript_12496/m.25096 type:complete len:584 (+) Transcript_12496:162-1913(+)|eukprot:CAMPEP_0118803776 /NCGR_PEP_ID=MMETSP1161-20130426/19222_1 /TAXON_ID=249345 /ORGANISM="Picochlorum oklahomensis, Strain CCMP2329" /LENGTH=583 /DNA_ID=CAMNT_0006732353 /DNA_START=105 /DNA_END=1856 /DNA_ORIENTATION=-